MTNPFFTPENIAKARAIGKRIHIREKVAKARADALKAKALKAKALKAKAKPKPKSKTKK